MQLRHKYPTQANKEIRTILITTMMKKTATRHTTAPILSALYTRSCFRTLTIYCSKLNRCGSLLLVLSALSRHLLHQINPEYFSFRKCRFAMSSSKQSTARVVARDLMDIVHSFTLEVCKSCINQLGSDRWSNFDSPSLANCCHELMQSSFHAFNGGRTLFTPEHWKRVGEVLVEGMQRVSFHYTVWAGYDTSEAQAQSHSYAGCCRCTLCCMEATWQMTVGTRQKLTNCCLNKPQTSWMRLDRVARSSSQRIQHISLTSWCTPLKYLGG